MTENSSKILADLTIVVPVHNGMPYLIKLIEKLKENIHLGFYVIFAEDSSTDGTRELLASWRHERIKVLYSTTKLSLSDNWTLPVEKVFTRYTKLLCVDDDFDFDFAKSAVNILRNNNQVLAVSGRSEILLERENRKLKLRISTWPFFGLIGCSRVANFMVLSGRNVLGAPSTIIFDTLSLKAAMPWDDQFPYMIDVATYFRILLSPDNQERFVYSSPGIAGTFRVRPGSVSDNNRDTQLAQWRSVVSRSYANRPNTEKFVYIVIGYTSAFVWNLGKKLMLKTLSLGNQIINLKI